MVLWNERVVHEKLGIVWKGIGRYRHNLEFVKKGGLIAQPGESTLICAGMTKHLER
jgi:hypothetical protein